jgi:chaperonin GroEL (HSP60 family)
MTYYTGSRIYTTKLLDMVDEGILDPKAVMEACLCYMSEHDVEDMMLVNDFLLAKRKKKSTRK